MIGQTLGHYRIESKLGEGGMGVVYRAQDTKLGRAVAIKLLPEAFARDPERLDRFEREARVLATLNHPNIAAIYGFEQFDGRPFLVLELVAGPTLAERLASGPLELEDTQQIAAQIAEALEAAHEKGIIHRDLKPANVKVNPEGRVKVLDFGLAKAFVGDPAEPASPTSPTLTVAATEAGVLLGTASYMSPEQARGRAADRRADIWAFGCVLYELLTGHRAFGGESISDTLAAVLKSEPDWTALPAETPENLWRLLRRCLAKDPRRRLHDIADARIELDQPATAATPVRTAVRRWAGWPLPALVMLTVLLAAALAWSLLHTSYAPPPPVARFVLPLPNAPPLPPLSLAVSPDGKRLAYVGRSLSAFQIYIREMDQLDAKPVAGTEGAFTPFFSPDGQWLAFFAAGKLKKIPLTGGVALTLCDAPTPRGGSWGADDTIIFAPGAATTGLSRISVGGGTPQVLTTLDTKSGETTHRWPEILPGGKAVLFSAGVAGAARIDEGRIKVLSLKTGAQQVVLEGGVHARYAPSGHIVYLRNGSLFAVPFDLARLKVTGPAAPVAEGILMGFTSGTAGFAFSPTGTLVYVPLGESANRSLVWVDRRGAVKPIAAPVRAYSDPRLSPDGRRVVVEVGVGLEDIWVYDLERGTLTRLTFATVAVEPRWTLDGTRVVYRITKAGTGAGYGLQWVAADGGPPESLLEPGKFVFTPSCWSPDGKAFLMSGFDLESNEAGIWTMPLDGDRKPRPLIRPPFSVTAPDVSPELPGKSTPRWLAYQSNESGRSEIYVLPYPGSASTAGGKVQISTDGGTEPRWAKNGRELFYRNGDKMMVVDMQTSPTFRAAAPRVLFEGRYEAPGYDVAPDGQRFLMVKPAEASAGPKQAMVVLEWFQELKRRVPPRIH